MPILLTALSLSVQPVHTCSGTPARKPARCPDRPGTWDRSASLPHLPGLRSHFLPLPRAPFSRSLRARDPPPSELSRVPGPHCATLSAAGSRRGCSCPTAGGGWSLVVVSHSVTKLLPFRETSKVREVLKFRGGCCLHRTVPGRGPRAVALAAWGVSVPSAPRVPGPPFFSPAGCAPLCPSPH